MRHRLPLPYGHYLRCNQETDLSFEFLDEFFSPHYIRSTPTGQLSSTSTSSRAWVRNSIANLQERLAGQPGRGLGVVVRRVSVRDY